MDSPRESKRGKAERLKEEKIKSDSCSGVAIVKEEPKLSNKLDDYIENILDADPTVNSVGKKKLDENENVVKLSQAISKKARLEFFKRKEQLQHFENEKHYLQEQLYKVIVRKTSTVLKKDEKITQQSQDMASLLTMYNNLTIKKTEADEELNRLEEQKIKVQENIVQFDKQIEQLAFRKSKLEIDHDNELKTLNEQSNADNLVMDSLQLKLEKLDTNMEQIINCDTAEDITELENKIRLECLNKQIEATEKLLECPLCLETTEAPIFQCGEGHLICSKCKPKIIKCPECQMIYRGPNKRNRYAERDAEQLKALIREMYNMLQETGDNASATKKTSVMPQEQVREKIQEILARHKSSNEELFDWIDTTMGEQAKSLTFIRTLVTCVAENSIDGIGELGIRCKLNKEALELRNPVLKKYLNEDLKCEMEALFALQHLMIKLKNPHRLLLSLFDNLYENEVLSEEAFFAWELNQDPAEQEGKGVALKSCTLFFKWLKEAQMEEDLEEEITSWGCP